MPCHIQHTTHVGCLTRPMNEMTGSRSRYPPNRISTRSASACTMYMYILFLFGSLHPAKSVSLSRGLFLFDLLKMNLNLIFDFFHVALATYFSKTKQKIGKNETDKKFWLILHLLAYAVCCCYAPFKHGSNHPLPISMPSSISSSQPAIILHALVEFPSPDKVLHHEARSNTIHLTHGHFKWAPIIQATGKNQQIMK